MLTVALGYCESVLIGFYEFFFDVLAQDVFGMSYAAAEPPVCLLVFCVLIYARSAARKCTLITGHPPVFQIFALPFLLARIL
jgi:hypothetical protein